MRLWCPPGQIKHVTDPYPPKRDDGEGVADWRKRMASQAGKDMYRKRAQHECINAGARRMGLVQLTVRGKLKARAALLLVALAHNMLRSFAVAGCRGARLMSPSNRRPRAAVRLPDNSTQAGDQRRLTCNLSGHWRLELICASSNAARFNTFSPSQERVVSFLLEMADRTPAGHPIELPMSRQDIADDWGSPSKRYRAR